MSEVWLIMLQMIHEIVMKAEAHKQKKQAEMHSEQYFAVC